MSRPTRPARVAAVAGLALGVAAAAGDAAAGAFALGDVTHPIGYEGAPGFPDMKVCIAPSVPAATARAMERPVRAALSRWNRLEPTTANVRPRFLEGGRIDFESVLLHELGHCSGLAHANQDAEDVDRAFAPEVASTHSEPGPDGVFTYDPGPDGVYGSADDRRGDDLNRYLFRSLVNDPFSMPETVDSTTYSTDVANLPAGDAFPANAGLEVGVLKGVPDTEAVMQQYLFVGETRRTPSHDDVSARRYAMSGLDELAGTADDYRATFAYGGVGEGADGCDVTIVEDARTALAYCGYELYSAPGTDHWRVASGATIGFSPDLAFAYDESAPCRGSTTLPQGGWKQVSLPCEVGLAGGGTLADVFGDDLPVAEYATGPGTGFDPGPAPVPGANRPVGATWAMVAHGHDDDGSAAYRSVALDEVLESGVAYWMLTLDPDVTIDVEGDYHSQLDADLSIDVGRGSGWNLVGNPFRAPTPWADARVVDVDGAALALAAADPGPAGAVVGETACTDARGPRPTCLAGRFAYRWDAARGGYEVLSPGNGTLAPMDGAWVFAARDDVELRIAMPEAERVAR